MSTLTADRITAIIMKALPKDCSSETMSFALDLRDAFHSELLQTRDYAIFATDTDGSSRKACTVYAHDEADAKRLAAEMGVKRIEYAVEVV
ncbi:MAG: hypothetical protein EOP83_34925 [Verrucomicrobiaceae bacterium]|nr:MAG: hypothetical protein EOP83_34925 [Verrucomicrobiaceae bacterium]